jgi:hypothetical protein
MNIYPQIVYSPNSGAPAPGSIHSVLYIGIFDAATNQAAPGNGIAVTYQPIYNGVPGDNITVHVVGTLFKIFDGVTAVIDDDGTSVPYFDAVIVSWDGIAPTDPPPNTAVCDAVINSVNIDKKESSPGAADGQITIIAQSSMLPLAYSLDGTNFQDSPVFPSLHGGAYTAYISDANGCTATNGFTVM